MFNKREEQYVLRISKKLKAIEILGGKCKICGEKDPVVLDFHHVDPKTKKKGINDIKQTRWSAISSEIKKCILLCGNCHAELHYKNSRNGQIVTDFLSKNNITCCNECKYMGKNMSSLEFHHISPSNKKFGINQGLLRKIKITKQELDEEIKKCIVICRNCHRKKHFDYNRYNNLKRKIDSKISSYKEIQPKLNREKIKQLIKNGETQKKIASIFNASKGTISEIAKELKLRKKKTKYTCKKICPSCKKEFISTRNTTKTCSRKCGAKKAERPSPEILKNMIESKTYKEIGEQYGVSASSICHWVKL